MKIIIIGSGIIGLTIAWELAQSKNNIVIIDKEKNVGAHASGRNSGVLHSGIYYPKETLKAKFCAEGKPLFREFCETYDIPLNQCGKVLVTKTENECESLSLLEKRAKENDIQVSWLDESQLKEKDPLAKTVRNAIWVPETAVFDPKKVVSALQHQLSEQSNVSILMGAGFIEKVSENTIKTTSGELKADIIINSAGGYADKIAHKFGVAKNLHLIPFKGVYKKLKPSIAKNMHHHIYPVPDLENPFLGVHFTKSINGDVYAGPTAIPAFGAENYKIFEKLSIDSFRILAKDATLFLKNPKFRRVALTEPKRYIHHYFYQEAKQLVNSLASSDLVATDKIGIRPQLVNWDTKELMMDFNIQAKDNHIHILNAISPAFTCCFAFAKYICKEYLNQLN